MNWIKRKFRVLIFKWKLHRFVWFLRRNGVPNSVIGNVLLSIVGEYPREKAKEELNAFFKEPN